MEKGLVLRPSYWASVSGGKDSLFMKKDDLQKAREELTYNTKMKRDYEK